MTYRGSVEELFDLAIGMEKAAESLYGELAVKFAHEEEVAAFWKAYAKEEAAHARWLEQIKGKLAPEVLARETSGEMLKMAKGSLELAIEEIVERIGDLDDAYELANEMESGETNAIFEFLIEEYEVAQESRQFLRAQLKQHVMKVVTGFPERYSGRASRQALKAME
jgi:rubrerythrin